MTRAQYDDALRSRFWEYVRNRSLDASLFDRPPKDEVGRQRRPPVFASHALASNVLVRPGSTKEEQDFVVGALHHGARHVWFGSMRSSQALAQSVFANLAWAKRLDALRVGARGESAFPLDALTGNPELEHECSQFSEADGRRTSVDVFFAGGTRVAVECKLREDGFGTCSRTKRNAGEVLCDGTFRRQQGRRHRCELAEQGIRYWAVRSETVQVGCHR